MDWLRSEDLKEEKVLTTSKLTITRQGSIYLSQIGPCDRFGASFVRSCRISGSKSEMPRTAWSGQRERANLVAKEFADRPNPARAKHVRMPHLIWR